MARPEAGVYVAAWVAALAAVATPAAAGEPRPKLGLVWVDPVRLAPGAYGVMKAESSCVLAGLGAEVSWTQALDGAVLGPESMAVIAVPTHHSADGETRHVMGAARPHPSLPPAVWVYPDEIAWALGLDPRAHSSWGPGERAVFGRALARVVSHEVVHALGVPWHAARGLMAARLARRALTAPTITVDADTVSVLKRTLAGPMVAGEPAAASRAGAAMAVPEGVIGRRGPSR
jgi:hypothetical protein